MPVTVYIPTPFRKLTGNDARVEAEAADLAGLLAVLEDRFPGLRERVLDEQGAIQGQRERGPEKTRVGVLHELFEHARHGARDREPTVNLPPAVYAHTDQKHDDAVVTHGRHSFSLNGFHNLLLSR